MKMVDALLRNPFPNVPTVLNASPLLPSSKIIRCPTLLVRSSIASGTKNLHRERMAKYSTFSYELPKNDSETMVRFSCDLHL